MIKEKVLYKIRCSTCYGIINCRFKQTLKANVEIDCRNCDKKTEFRVWKKYRKVLTEPDQKRGGRYEV